MDKCKIKFFSENITLYSTILNFVNFSNQFFKPSCNYIMQIFLGLIFPFFWDRSNELVDISKTVSKKCNLSFEFVSYGVNLIVLVEGGTLSCIEKRIYMFW